MGRIRVGTYEVNVVKRIEQKRKEYPLCDKEGNEVTTEYTPSKKVFKNKDGVVIEKLYRLINNIPQAKFKKTDAVNYYEEVSINAVEDLIAESYYYCECEVLRQYLKKNKKAFRFLYTNGNGYKAYISYLLPFKSHLIMVCGFGGITQQIAEITAERVSEEVKEEVVRANPEELMLLEGKKKAKEK